MVEHMMALGRRGLLGGGVMLSLGGVAAAAARAEVAVLSVACDTTLAPALRKVAAAYRVRAGVRVYVFPTGPGLILPQLIRDIQNDVVVTQVAIMQQVAQAGIIASADGGRRWRNPLVISGLVGATVTDGPFAVSDPSPASDIDGPAILMRLGLQPAHLMGAVDTDEVAFLLTTGAAQAGLLHMTDVRAAPGLGVIRPLPADIAPIVYGASVTRLASRPNPGGFVTYLGTPEATALLSESGLEVQA
jgi:Bacterial extracellular solute-binding protein